MTTALLTAAGNRVTVGQQHRVGMLFGADRGGERAHHVRAVEVEGDLAKALGLALGAEHRAGLVQAFQRGVALRVDAHAAVNDELLLRRLQGQVAVAQLIVGGAQLAVIQLQLQQLQLLAVQHQRRQAGTGLGVTPHYQLGMDQGVILEQLEGQVSLVDQVVGHLIVLEVDHLRLFGTHGLWPLIRNVRRPGRPCICAD